MDALWSSSNSIQAGALVFAVALTCPAGARLVRWLRHSDREGPSSGSEQRYHDEDGEASEESTKSFADRFQRAAFATSAFAGSLTSFARLTLAWSSTGWLDQAFQLGIWASLMLQSLALFTEPSAPHRFYLGIQGSINCLNLLCTLSLGAYINMFDWSDPTSRECMLMTAEFASAGLACLHGFLLPRRPDVFWRGGPVDRQFTSSVIGRLSFSWPSPALRAFCGKQALEVDSLPQLDCKTRSLYLLQRFRQQEALSEGHEALWRVLIFSYSRELVVQLGLTIVASIISFVPHMMLLGILQVMERDAEGESRLTALVPWSLGLGLGIVFTTLAQQWTVWLSSMDLGVKMQRQLTMVLFDKMLRGAASSLSLAWTRKRENALEEMDGSGLHVINLVALDAQQVGNCVRDMYRGYEVLIKMVLSGVLVERLMGWQSLVAGSSLMLFLFAVNAHIARRYSRDQSVLAARNDIRMAAVTEALQGIRQIKFSGSEQNWESCILERRRKELYAQRTVNQWNIGAQAICTVSPILLSAVIIALHVYTTGTLKASSAFTCLSILGSVDNALSAIPQLQSGWVGAMISLKRLESYLHSPDRHFPSIKDDEISFEKATIRWQGSDTEGFRLTDLTLCFPSHAISVIEGPTRSGKSLLLAAILGECELAHGTVRKPCYASPPYGDMMESAIAYVAQTPWIENATIVENITFGSPMQRKRYRKVLHACALETDLAAFKDGDRTEIGPRGVNLSGGQASRIALARALYSRATTLVLDDIFSTVDARTSRHMSDNVLGGSLVKGRTVILASHHPSLYMPYADYVVSLLGEGKYRCGPAVTTVVPGLKDAPYTAEAMAPTYACEVQSTHSRKPSSLWSLDPSVITDCVESPAAHEFVQDEQQPTTGFQHETLGLYLRRVGSHWYGIFVLSLYTGYACAVVGQLWWVARWAHQSEENPARTVHSEFLAVYVGLATMACTAGIMRSHLTYASAMYAARRLFLMLLHAVLHAPLDFLDRNPLGRILNRFSSDMAVIDSQVGQILGGALTGALDLVAIFGVGTSVSWWILPVSMLMLLLCAHSASGFYEAARKLKYLDNVSRNLVLENFSSTLDGLPTIRALLQRERYMRKFAAQVDDNTRAVWNLWLVNSWFGLRMALVGSVFVTAATLVIVSMPSITVAMTGFALAFLLRYTAVVSAFIRNLINLELALGSIDRVLEYTQAPSEKYEGRMPPAAWPEEGHLDVANLVVRHAPHMAPALDRISFQLLPNERVGVVGRTGAGKSSLAMSLFRLLEAEQGSITLDGIDIASVALQQLRQRLAIIPQDPHLFSGTVRSNLDPFHAHDDTELLYALECVHWPGYSRGSREHTSIFLEADVQAHGVLSPLNQPVLAGGHNLSQGQRQQLSLARAIVTRPKLLILDEATSSMDPGTNTLIQESVRELSARGFASTLVIAHRISTVMDFDRILVLDKGLAVEWGSPEELLKRPNGCFRGLMEDSGKAVGECGLKEVEEERDDGAGVLENGGEGANGRGERLVKVRSDEYGHREYRYSYMSTTQSYDA